MIQLRPYQQQAVNKLLWSQKLEGADLCVLPTGAGKSLVIAELARQLNRPVLILQPSKEILEQNYQKLSLVIDPTQIGVYSASMNRKDLGFYTFATIQSIYKKPEIFSHFTVVIIDECHLVNPKNLDGMFTSFLKEIGNPKVIGLTATPYRMGQWYERLSNGGILTHTTTKLINRLKERFWHRIIFNINNQNLINAGYLVPLRYIDKSFMDHKDIPTNITHSDFDLGQFENIMKTKEDEILEALYFAQELGKHVLVFCSSVSQGKRFKELLEGSEVVTALTPKRERERIIQGFKNGSIHTVFNVGVLTTGFDHPALDCIVLLRPTQSIALYYQMLGRGVRPYEGKNFCRVIDMTGTVKKMGKIETIKLVRRDMWELESETNQNWHNYPLYSYLIEKPNDADSSNPFL